MQFSTITVDPTVQAVAAEMLAADAVAIVGAGASIAAGYPLTAHLSPHLWRAVEADPQVLRGIASRLGQSELSAKAMIGDDETVLRLAYALVKASPTARAAFQGSFQALDRERSTTVSPAHDALAELLHRRRIETVISLNWDTMLEAAYRRRYGRRLRADGIWLHKPHGDAAEPGTSWVLPHEPGLIPEELADAMRHLVATRPRLLLIVGYSEQDDTVVAKLIAPLAARWRVARIGPTAIGELAIPEVADTVLPAIRDLVTRRGPEALGWEYVPFANQNDLGAALDGRGLGPSDVQACPKLPEVHTALEGLGTAHRVIISGDPGSGKSMVAYHAAYELLQNGWEVLRLSDPPRDGAVLLAALSSLPTPTVIVVDDAQSMDPSLIRSLQERANARLALIVVTNTSPGDYRGVVTVVKERAVQSLASALRLRRSETLDVVHRFDERVGDGWMEHRLEQRLEEASRAQLPWQFSFILTAGERRARAHIAALAERERADLLLSIIAALQLATLDVGCPLADLEPYGQAIGRDASWVARALDEIQSHRLLIVGDHVRCPHQRYAIAVLRIVLDKRREPAWSQLLKGLRAVIMEKDRPLTGIAILLRELWFAEAFPYDSRGGTIIDDSVWAHLTARCLEASSANERAGAGYLLEALDDYHSGRLEWITANAKTIGTWIAEATGESAWGLDRLMNDLLNHRREDPRPFAAVMANSDPSRVAAAFTAAPLTEMYAWHSLLGSLSVAEKTWRTSFRAALPDATYLARAGSATASTAHYTAAMAETLFRYDYELGLTMLERAAPAIASRISTNLPEAYGYFYETFWHPLGFRERMFDPPPRKARQRAVARTILRMVDVERAAASISRAPRRDLSSAARFLSIILEAAPSVGMGIISHLDFGELDSATSGLWADPPDELYEFISVLGRSRNNWEPARAWITSHTAELRNVPARFAIVAPEAALAAMRAGGKISLPIAGVLGWAIPYVALHTVASCDQTAARSVAMGHVDKLAEEFLIKQDNQCEHLDYFVSLLQLVAPEALFAAFDRMNPDQVREHWAARLRGKAEERHAAAALVTAAASNPGPLQALARELMDRFPRSTRTSPGELRRQVEELLLDE